jgi:hypothetical protein
MATLPPKLEQSLEKIFPGVEFLTISDATFLPGTVVNKLRPVTKQGHVKSIISGKPSSYWDTDRVKGNILAGDTLTGSADFNGAVSLLSFLKVKTSVKNSYSYKYDIDSIEASNFLNTSRLDLMPLLRQIKTSNIATWRSIRSFYIVTETYYAKSFSITLQKNGSIVTQAEFNQDFEKISADVNFDFGNGGKIVVANNNDVPFGFSAFRIKDV